LSQCGEKLPIIAASFNKLVEAMERICKRAEGDAVDFTKLGHNVESVIEAEYATEWLASEKSYKVLKDRFESVGRVKSEIVSSLFFFFLFPLPQSYPFRESKTRKKKKKKKNSS